jgi:hypothetical protein
LALVRSRRELLEAFEQLVQAVAGAGGSDEAQVLLAQLEASGTEVLGDLIRFCERAATPLAADFLALCGLLANDTISRKEALLALEEMAAKGVHARSPFLPPLRQKRLLAALIASDGLGKGDRLLTLWQREGGLGQAYLFHLDPEGALTGFEASRNLTPSQAGEMTATAGGIRISAKEAASLVRRALDIARAKGLALPGDYVRQHRFVEESVFAK